MRKLPPRRMSAVGSAAIAAALQPAAEAAEAAFQAQLREANIKLELKPKMRELALKMQANLDKELKKAVERFLGFEVTDPRQVAGRLTHSNGPDFTEYCVDGVPVLRAGPQTMQRKGDELHAYQAVAQLLPEDYQPAARGGIILP